jgi:putative addiction module killer protein
VSTIPKKVVIFEDANGNEPFTQWLMRLRDGMSQKRILARIRRVEQGNYGDYKAVGDGIFELRLFFGSGYRVYFGEDDETLVVLLMGGDKDSQDRDIAKAQAYWLEYQDGKKV